MLSTLLKLVITLGILAISIFLVLHYGVEDVREAIKQSGIYAPLVFILICIVKPILIFLPSLGLTVIAGLLFGPVYGTLYVVIGGAGSTLTGFYFAKWLGRDFIERLARNKKMFSFFEDWMREKGRNTILAMRFFNLPWDMVSYWAGFTGVSFKDFYLASLIPLIPMSFLYVYFGSTILSPSKPGFIISLLIILAISSIPYIRKRYRGKKNA